MILHEITFVRRSTLDVYVCYDANDWRMKSFPIDREVRTILWMMAEAMLGRYGDDPAGWPKSDTPEEGEKA